MQGENAMRRGNGIAAQRGRWLALLLALAVQAAADAAPAAGDELEIGRRIYEEGLLASGAPLAGERPGGTAVAAAAAACATCHRHSGMGSVEGDLLVPPITGNYLFGTGSKNMANMDPRRGKALNQAHAPYTDAALARAIRDGENNNGRVMSMAMPRYDLSAAEMAALTAYLRQLSPQWSPGVDAGSIRFATVIAPGVAAERRQALLDLLRAAIVQKNGSTLPGRRHMISPAEMLSRTERTWSLDVWELQGDASTWRAQLEEKYRRQPVFALLSGVGDGTWQPVHDFCEQARVPCWFPSVDLPPTAAASHYSVYFSRGLALEADVLARHLQAQAAPPRRLLQVYRDDDAGRRAAAALRQALAGSGIGVEDRVLNAATADDARLLQSIGAAEAVMFWLRAPDLQRWQRVGTAPAGQIYFSAGLGGAEHVPVPAAWKQTAALVYPFELPDRRQTNLAYFHDWLKLRKLALVDEKLQAEAYFAVAFLTDTIADMLDNLYREYLLERAENMLSRREGGKVEQEARERSMLGWHGRSISGRPAVVRGLAPGVGAAMAAPAPTGSATESTTIYPRLGLGPDQRFASKGGYIVRFAGGDGERLVAASDWIVP